MSVKGKNVILESTYCCDNLSENLEYIVRFVLTLSL